MTKTKNTKKKTVSKPKTKKKAVWAVPQPSLKNLKDKDTITNVLGLLGDVRDSLTNEGVFNFSTNVSTSEYTTSEGSLDLECSEHVNFSTNDGYTISISRNY